jgi:hypothetical protein
MEQMERFLDNLLGLLTLKQEVVETQLWALVLLHLQLLLQ